MNKKDLISKIKTLTDISTEERAYLIDLINTKKKYGIVWENKTEDVEEQLRSMLPVLNEIKDKAIVNSAEHPNHILIEGDNLHALTALTFTHEGKIDVIYIDPPYNTGNKDWKYNNDYVDSEDNFRHSKWLSMMKSRLSLAKNLLSEKGIIICAIDHYELFTLGCLMDEIFREENRIGIVSVIHKPEGRNQEKFFGTSNEFALFYSKNKSICNFQKVVLDEQIQNQYDLTDEIGQFKLETFIRKNRGEQGIDTGLRINRPNSWYPLFVNRDTLEISLNKDNEQYIEILPIGNNNQERTWDASEENVQQKIQNKVLVAKKEKDSTIKIYVKKYANQVIKTHWIDSKYHAVTYGTRVLTDIIGAGKFNFPKSLFLIRDILKLVSSENAIILDFFAGSGTTLHATMALNEEDGGNRQCILVTNNENNICEEVTYERNKRVIEGYSNAKGIAIEGLKNNNLRYFKAGFVPSERNEVNRRKLTQESTDLLCIKENCYGNVSKEFLINEKEAKLFTNGLGKYMLVLYHSRNQMEVIEKLTAIIPTIATKEKIKLYAFSPEKETIEEDFFKVADKIEAVPLPDSIYNAYRATFRTLKLDKTHKQ
jgi:adenine-specific DNA-methyltransferase